MNDITIEVRCQGGFAYLRGKGGKRWLAVPPLHHAPAQDEHLCQLHVLKDSVDPAALDNFVNTSLPAGFDLGDYVRFKHTLNGLEIVGATHAPHKPGITDEIPGNGLPNNGGANDNSWTSQKFIAGMHRFDPPQLEPVADIGKAVFLMTLPDDTEWHGLRPSDFRMQKCKWKFVNEKTHATFQVKQQAITDVVGLHLTVPPQTTLRIQTNSGLVTVGVKFVAGSESPLKLIAGPQEASAPVVGEILEHFAHLYHLCAPEPGVDNVVPKCMGPITELPAGDIFCPGGEGEGEGGG